MVDITGLFGRFDPVGAYAKGAALRKGWDQDAALKETFSNMPVGADGKPDFMAAAQKLFAVGATGPGMGLAQLAQAQADKEIARNQWQQSFGLQQQQFNRQTANDERNYKLQVQNAQRREPVITEVGTPDGRKQKSIVNPLTGQVTPLGAPMGDEVKLDGGSRKAIFEAEDEIPQIESTLKDLARARELSSKAFSGYSAGARGAIGTFDPTGLASKVIDPEAARATVELGQILSAEAITRMSATLKGASTDREMAEFQRILSDPRSPPELKQKTIDRMSQLAERQLQVKRDRINQLRGGNYFKQGGGSSVPQGQPAPAAQQGQPAKISDQSQYDQLPSGTKYIAPDGTLRTKR